jgi:hypothetical protein
LEKSFKNGIRVLVLNNKKDAICILPSTVLYAAPAGALHPSAAPIMTVDPSQQTALLRLQIGPENVTSRGTRRKILEPTTIGKEKAPQHHAPTQKIYCTKIRKKLSESFQKRLYCIMIITSPPFAGFRRLTEG